MSRLARMALILCVPCLAADTPAAQPEFWTQLRAVIASHLGRPYVWGATGLKSFDCSGFVWRVYYDSGVVLKRTTARKLWFSLPAPERGRQYAFGNLVFFNDLKHVGIVNNGETFFHAESSIGTNQSRFEPYWRKHVAGVRAGPYTR